MARVRNNGLNLFILFLLVNPIWTTGEKLNGCFTKKGWTLYAGTTTVITYKEVESLAMCALYCSTELDWCDGFNFIPNKTKGSSNCFPRQGAKLRAQSKTARWLRIGGWCPNNKGLVASDAPGITPKTIESSPLQCSSQGDVCQFPVRVAGIVYWTCLDRKGVKVCNTQDPQSANEIQTFDNLDTFRACEKCDSAGCFKSDTGYSGFALKKQHHANIYKDVESAEDCQQICQSAEGCTFFGFENSKCYLKYGVGKKCLGCPNFFFGPKFCPVDCEAKNSTRSLGPCNDSCGGEGMRIVTLSPEVRVPAKHGGTQCEDTVTTVMEKCTGECTLTNKDYIMIGVGSGAGLTILTLLGVILWHIQPRGGQGGGIWRWRHR